MNYRNAKKLVQTAKDYRIEIIDDDEINKLILENTNCKTKPLIKAVYRAMVLIAGGTSYRTTCRLTGLPQSTLTQWRKNEWWDEAIELVRQRTDDELDGVLTSGIKKGTERLHERLDKGDPVVKRDGAIIYKPVSAKDAAIITSILFDKRNLLRNKPTSITSSQSSDERLDFLASRFRDIAKNHDYEVIDAEIVNNDETDTQRDPEVTKIEHAKEVTSKFTFKDSSTEDKV